MKCCNCGVKIGSEFKFAFKYNKCPACDKSIMPQDKIAAYVSLQLLLKNNFPDTPIDQITNLVVANFELKQLFKDGGAAEVDYDDDDDVVEVIEEVDPDVAFDQAHKKAQMETAKKKIREQAYEDALKDQWGLGEGGDGDIFEGPSTEVVNPTEEVLKMVDEAKKQERQANMMSGVGGFSRSG